MMKNSCVAHFRVCTKPASTLGFTVLFQDSAPEGANVLGGHAYVHIHVCAL